MNYENSVCSYCGKTLRAEDDVVVCPVCATPQHRECWMKNGCCVNESLHASGYVWSASVQNTPEEAVDTDDTKICPICSSENPCSASNCGNCGAFFGQQKTEEQTEKVCAFCGKENDSDALHCKYCGSPLGANSPYFNDNPYLAGTGFAPDELIGGIKAGDIAIYTQASSKRYLPKFKKIANGKKLSFNFAAFFFAPYWFFFRKIYKAGIFALAVFVTATLMMSGLSNEINAEVNSYANLMADFDFENATEQELAAFETELEAAAKKMVDETKGPMAIVLGVQLAINLVCALVADRLYYKKMKEDLRLIDEGVKEPNMRKIMISRRGGLSVIAFAASYMGFNTIVQLLAVGVNTIMQSF